jgi:hypothetical protein
MLGQADLERLVGFDHLGLILQVQLSMWTKLAYLAMVRVEYSWLKEERSWPVKIAQCAIKMLRHQSRNGKRDAER